MFKLSSPFRLLAAVATTCWAKIAGYEILAADEVSADRLDICATCPLLTEDRQCQVCTCFVDYKAILALEQCPMRKWKRVWVKRKKN